VAFSEIQIRADIATVITLVTASLIPPPIIIARDIMNLTDAGWVNVLRDQDGLESFTVGR